MSSTCRPCSRLADPVSPAGILRLSLASSANATLAATEFFDGTHHIVRLDLNSRTGSEPATLGVFKNLTANDVALVASSNGSSILAVEADGSVLLYDAVQDTFTVSRQDFTALSGRLCRLCLRSICGRQQSAEFVACSGAAV